MENNYTLTQTEIEYIESKINYKFKDTNLLIEAFTHATLQKELGYSNQRLEFLGDAVLAFISAEYIYKKYNEAEGNMTRIRADVVRQDSLSNIIDKLDVAKYLILLRNLKQPQLRNLASTKSDLFESIVAAIYLDGGIEKATEFVIREIAVSVEKSYKGVLFFNYKSVLQEFLQRDGEIKIEYRLDSEEMIDLAPRFTMSVYVRGNKRGMGVGGTKKAAEQMAAKVALEFYNYKFED